MGKRPPESLDSVKAKKQKTERDAEKVDGIGKSPDIAEVKEQKQRRKLEESGQRLANGVENVESAKVENGQSHVGANRVEIPGGKDTETKVQKKKKRDKGDKTNRKTEDRATVGGMGKEDIADLLRTTMGNMEHPHRELTNLDSENPVHQKEAVTEAKRVAKKAKKSKKIGGTTQRSDDEKPEKEIMAIDTSTQNGISKVGTSGTRPSELLSKGKVQPESNGREDFAARKAAKAVRKAGKAEKKKLKAAKAMQFSSNGDMNVSGTPNHINGVEIDGEHLESSSTTAQVRDNQYNEHPSLSSLPQSSITAYLEENFITITDPTTTNPLRPIISFSQLESNFTSSESPFATFKDPTPIQSASWPFLFSGRDVIGVAETGSGKTLAFGIPCIRSLQSSLAANPPSLQPKSSNRTSPARAVIISPTRELAIQIHDQLSTLATPASLSTACLYGGVPKDTQRHALETAHIIVATPGRLNDLIDEGHANLSSIHYLVLDEADRMLDKGFEDQIRNIITHIPSTRRQTLMLTATWPPSVRALASTFMSNPVHIAIGADNPTGELRANTRIVQKIEVVAPEAKQARMLQIIQTHHQPRKGKDGTKKKERILAFCLYKKEAVRVENFLRSRGLSVAAIHGDMSQSARLASLESFKSGSCPLLVATDVAARGLDIPSVKLVLNITFPLTVEDYVHRIGRTGRAGKEGLAITLFTMHEKGQAGALVNVLRAAGQDVPEELLNFGGTVKRKEHAVYGAFARDVGEGARSKGTKIRFD